MRFTERLDQSSQSLLCIGLDIDLNKVPAEHKRAPDPIFSFNKHIIDATADFVCAYKPNIAFYEMYGTKGLDALTKTIDYIHAKNILVILDAKRGDIGNSSAAYARAAFEVFKADAVTVNPYMGEDSIEPFANYVDKGIFILCLTSNPGAKDFQTRENLYKQVAKKAVKWDHNQNIGLVVGATKPGQLKEIRKIVGRMPILIPGVGTQGGDLIQSVKAGIDKSGGRAIINVSRAVIYSNNPRKMAQDLRDKINFIRK